MKRLRCSRIRAKDLSGGRYLRIDLAAQSGGCCCVRLQQRRIHGFGVYALESTGSEHVEERPGDAIRKSCSSRNAVGSRLGDHRNRLRREQRTWIDLPLWPAVAGRIPAMYCCCRNLGDGRFRRCHCSGLTSQHPTHSSACTRQRGHGRRRRRRSRRHTKRWRAACAEEQRRQSAGIGAPAFTRTRRQSQRLRLKDEDLAGGLRQKWEMPSSSGYLGQNAREVVAGVDRAGEADVVRLLWPTGVVQDEVQLASGRRHLIREIDRRGSSCPVVWVWNGEHYEFISDMIGPGIVGHSGRAG